ncbi:hypothetical protein A2903_03085 [Candidatus Nomurabacteria bacterium RIFCSPLOWO2_01_FULL_33_17]|uniref:Peptidoglycan binding-like domain-containing protein n=1 Tax=Candidatus Nomurabacteria bacterium RIFCSPLOWO2_01_FULL_33_17 TaxID=1801764 RepID=A0A1F6WQY6_9BACT|nr:MAG: hypothetical protein A2903_03085 [Candidatus Nomurabacteria bacterium RIFCSPLOWO2_01_FULL_33_17]
MNKKKTFISLLALMLVFTTSAVFAAQSYYIPEDDMDPTVENLTCEEIGLGTKHIKKGSVGTSVQILQEVMMNAGYYDEDTATGIVDANMVLAIKGMQSELGVKDDGIVGPITRGAMREICVDFVRGS